MALYIHPENQQLLWKIANQNPMVKSYFANYPENIQETWFKQIISSFYENNRNNVSTSEQLYEINKNSLAYMVQDVKRNIEYAQSRQQFASPPQQFAQQGPDHLKSYSVTENKEDKFMAQYNEFQQNYQSMFDKKVPESVDFSEKFSEGPISGNMEDLIQKHLRERDEELKRYAPPPFFGGGQAAITSNKLRIDPTPNNIQLTVDELPLRDPPPTAKPEPIFPKDTTVKWLDNENSDKIQVLETEITMLKNQVLQMSDKISFLINVNKDIFDFSAQRLRMTSVNISGGFLFDPQSSL